MKSDNNVLTGSAVDLVDSDIQHSRASVLSNVDPYLNAVCGKPLDEVLDEVSRLLLRQSPHRKRAGYRESSDSIHR